MVGEPGLQLLSVSTSCPAERRNSLTWAGDRVGVTLRIKNSSGVDASNSLRIRVPALPPATARALSEVRGIALAAGQSGDVSFSLDYDDVTALTQGELLKKTAAGWVAAGAFAAPFACVASCPAHSVIARHTRHARDGVLGAPLADSACATPSAAAGWVGRVAAANKSHTYCSYSWQPETGGAFKEPALGPLVNVLGSNGWDWEVDCDVVSTQGGLALDDLAAATDQRLGIGAASTASSSWPAPSHPVRLGIIDTAVHGFDETGKKNEDTSEHGRTVGLLAERTACLGSANCAVTVDNRLALPIVSTERTRTGWSIVEDRDNGGFIGSRGEIGAALYALLRDWDQANENLVVNLSVGWHRKHDCSTPGCGQSLHMDLESGLAVPDGTGTGFTSGAGVARSFSIGTEAVLVSIAEARCRGGLVVAAAGNAADEDDEGPLLPAAWANLDANALACGNAYNPTGASAPSNGPLVAAVGAVNFSGHPIALTRQGSLPPLLAHGAGIAVKDPARRSTGVRGGSGGTSFATAVVSGAAAALWSRLHRLDANRLLRALYDAGDPPPSTYAGTPAGPARLCPQPPGVACDVPVEVNACTVLKATAANVPALQLPASGCSAVRVEPLAAPPKVVVSQPLSCDQVSALENMGMPEDALAELEVSCSDDPVPEPPPHPHVDRLEAPWAVRSQPWGPKCQTCLQYTTPNDDWYTDYKVEFAFAEAEISLISAYVQALSGRMYVPSTFITTVDQTRRINGTLEFSVLYGASTPLKLVAEFAQNPAALGIYPVGSAELTQVQ